jgi:hypothetical protein
MRLLNGTSGSQRTLARYTKCQLSLFAAQIEAQLENE